MVKVYGNQYLFYHRPYPLPQTYVLYTFENVDKFGWLHIDINNKRHLSQAA